MSVNHAAALARNYPSQYPEEPQHTDHLTYGSGNRDKDGKISRKERGGSTYDRGVDGGRLGSKIKKLFQVEERGHPRSDMSSKPRHYQNEEERLREDRNYYRDKSHTLERSVNQYQEENRRLRDDLDDEKDRFERAVRSADHMQSTMDNREYFLGEQASDDDVCTMFMTLMNEIKNWSQAFSHGSKRALREEMFKDYQKVTPMYTAFHNLEDSTANKKQKRFFVRGWTAYVMCTRLFRNHEGPAGGPGEDAWLDKPVAGSFQFLEDRLLCTDRQIVPYKSFNDWRAFTAELLGKTVNINNGRPVDQMQTLVKLAVSEVMELIEPWHKGGTPETLKIDQDKLRGIFVSAVKLSQVLRRQRALWTIRLPRAAEGGKAAPQLKFDPTSMEDERNNEEVSMEELRTLCVEFIVTPALYKRGQ